jgi:transcription elongation factor Elf1
MKAKPPATRNPVTDRAPLKLAITCERCGHVTELERKRGQLRNVVGRCKGCGASIGFRWQSVRSGT